MTRESRPLWHGRPPHVKRLPLVSKPEVVLVARQHRVIGDMIYINGIRKTRLHLWWAISEQCQPLYNVNASTTAASVSIGQVQL